VALLQAKSGPKRARVHHKIQKDGYNVGYLSKEPRCTPQVFGGSAPPLQVSHGLPYTKVPCNLGGVSLSDQLQLLTFRYA